METFLHEIMSDLEQLPIDLRESICRKCGWSQWTYNHRIRRPETFRHYEINIVFNTVRHMLMETLKEHKNILGDPYLKEYFKLPIGSSNNKMKELFRTIFNLQHILRRKILQECNWNKSTYLTCRRMGDVSSLEKQKIIALDYAVLKSVLVQTEAARKHYIHIKKHYEAKHESKS